MQMLTEHRSQIFHILEKLSSYHCSETFYPRRVSWFSLVVPDKWQGVPSELFTAALFTSYSSSVFITTSLFCIDLVKNGVVK